MSEHDESKTLEEVRIVIPNPHICARVTEVFQAAGISAYGDFRSETDEVMLRDAYHDEVEYIVFMSLGQQFETYFRPARHIRDLKIKVYLRDDRESKSMSVDAAVQMVQQRKSMTSN